MIANCSSPAATVIPVLAYADVAEAAEWLCRAFGFALRLRIGTHRAQLVFGDGAVIVTDMERDADARRPDYTHSVHVRVRDAAENVADRAKEAAATRKSERRAKRVAHAARR